jgi:hypothetical protein
MVLKIRLLISPSSNKRSVDVGRSEEKAAFLDVASLPALVLGNVSSFAFIFVHVCLIALQLDILAKGIKR